MLHGSGPQGIQHGSGHVSGAGNVMRTLDIDLNKVNQSCLEIILPHSEEKMAKSHIEQKTEPIISHMNSHTNNNFRIIMLSVNCVT